MRYARAPRRKNEMSGVLCKSTHQRRACPAAWRRPTGAPPSRRGWIAGVNSFKAHVKLVLFAGSALKPVPPQGKRKNSIDYHSEEEFDEKQLKAWLKQARKLPGWGRINQA
jgi:hypothetical protein